MQKDVFFMIYEITAAMFKVKNMCEWLRMKKQEFKKYIVHAIDMFMICVTQLNYQDFSTQIMKFEV